MLKVCWTLIELDTNFSVIGLGTSKRVNTMQGQSTYHNANNATRLNKTASAKHRVPVANAHVNMPLAKSPAQPVKQYAKDVDASGTGSLNAIHPAKSMPQHRPGETLEMVRSDVDTIRGILKKHTGAINASEDYKPQLDEVNVALVSFDGHLPVSK